MKKLARHTRVLVTDGARAIVLRNEGDAAHPDLKTVRAYVRGWYADVVAAQKPDWLVHAEPGETVYVP